MTEEQRKEAERQRILEEEKAEEARKKKEEKLRKKKEKEEEERKRKEQEEEERRIEEEKARKMNETFKMLESRATFRVLPKKTSAIGLMKEIEEQDKQQKSALQKALEAANQKVSGKRVSQVTQSPSASQQTPHCALLLPSTAPSCHE